ncbi:MAG: hypothetical protein AB7N71_14970 [Phycisphaerae bacterium]
MIRSIALMTTLTGAAFLFGGCSASGAGSTAFGMFKNSKAGKLEVDIWLDGQMAARNKLKQAATGHSRYKIATPISTNPSFKFDIKDEETTGRVSYTNVAIYEVRGSKPSDQPEYIITPTGSGAEAQMKSGQTYSLTNPGPGFRIMNWENKDVSSVQLKPGKEYMFQFVIRADDSETAQVWFTTN